MITIYSIKPAFQRLLQPIASLLVKWRVTPNQVTLFALLLSIGAGGHFIAHLNQLPYIALILFVRMALNALDGMMARMCKLETPFGCFLNELGDIVSDSAIYLPFAFLAPSHCYYVLPIIFLSTLSEVAGILGSTVGKKRRYDGPMGKSDRALAFGLLGIASAFTTSASIFIPAYLAIGALLLLSIYFRIKKSIDSCT